MSDSFATPWTAACQVPLSFTFSWSLLKFMSIELVMLSNHLILCCPLVLCLQSFPASGSFPVSQLFTSGGQSIGASASSSSSSNEYSGLISFRVDWFDLLAVQGNLKSLFQHHNSKESILWCSAFFMVQLWHLLEKEIATHSSTLAWKISWMEEPGRLQYVGSQRVRHDWATSPQ